MIVPEVGDAKTLDMSTPQMTATGCHTAGRNGEVFDLLNLKSLDIESAVVCL